jgi:DNA-binding Lrp family transcriptional regulator
MVKSSKFDELDRQLVQVLQLDGRLPFSRIAEVLGVSDQTIARRYTRLRTEGHMRVIASVDYAFMGQVTWLVRVQCKPDGAERLGRALAARDDTAWVNLSSGGTELNCSTWAPAAVVQESSLLLARLPRTPSVVSMTAHCVMHTFFGGPRGPVLKYGCLTPEQLDALLPEPSLLAELAAATGWSQSTARRRLAQLRASGAAFLDVEFDYQIYGLTSRALLWASVPPAELEAAGVALAGHPQVAYACATTGPTNLHAVLLCKDIHSLYTYLTTQVASLGVQRVETSPIMRGLKGPATIRAPR